MQTQCRRVACMCVDLTPRSPRQTLGILKLEGTNGIVNKKIHARVTVLERMIKKNNYWGLVRWLDG